ncbi:hypothetical protein L1887_58174 [Cichorium endivia]|nr:hypothetical protein L1887_58174 [Cichorium endivia]
MRTTLRSSSEHRDVDEADTMNVLHFAVNADPKTAVPRPPQHSSIPSLLTSLQNEYDAIILETFTLKKHYDNLRQELAHALYANDASARVIARLLNERDQAREALASIQGTIGAGPSSSKAAHDVEMTDSAPAGNGASNAAAGNGLSTEVVEIIDATAQRLSSQRKAKSKRKAPEGYATQSSVASFAVTQKLPSMHHAKPAGVSCLALSADGNVLVTGGNDKNVQTELSGPVTALHFSENGYYLAAASDQAKAVEVWDLRKLTAAGKMTVEEEGKGGVSAVRFDPSLQFLAVATDSVTVYANKSWAQLARFEGTANLTGLDWDHRDGSIVVSSLDRTVRTFGVLWARDFRCPKFLAFLAPFFSSAHDPAFITGSRSELDGSPWIGAHNGGISHYGRQTLEHLGEWLPAWLCPSFQGPIGTRAAGLKDGRGDDPAI